METPLERGPSNLKPVAQPLGLTYLLHNSSWFGMPRTCCVESLTPDRSSVYSHFCYAVFYDNVKSQGSWLLDK